MNKIFRTSVAVILIIIGVLAFFPETICASGSCDTLLGKIDDIRDAETEVIFVSESLICRAEVKAGQNLFNFYADGCDECFCVEGINTNTVTVTEVGTCLDMSNVSFYASPTAVTFIEVEVKGISSAVLAVVICGGIFLSLISVCVGFFLHMKGGE